MQKFQWQLLLSRLFYTKCTAKIHDSHFSYTCTSKHIPGWEGVCVGVRGGEGEGNELFFYLYKRLWFFWGKGVLSVVWRLFGRFVWLGNTLWYMSKKLTALFSAVLVICIQLVIKMNFLPLTNVYFFSFYYITRLKRTAARCRYFLNHFIKW